LRNLAGDKGAEASILDELGAAGVEAVDNGEDFNNGEAPSRFTGRLGSTITMRRLWYCWAVQCRVPIEVADEMWAHPVGYRDVRVAGHYARPSPREWFHGDHVTSYHIDTAAGLRLFVDTMHKHGLVMP
jgi:hypothetical protein